MNEAEVMLLLREAVLALLMIAGPVMLVALTVGLLMALFQSLTQLQEMTLAFIPKIVAVFLSLLVLMPFMIATLVGFTQQLADRIVQAG